ncbi:acyltransferase family protein [Paenibacillus radicibacter]|uniref:acyltransferase family protein n=1 Tax=Paenibacillus radicibacter TaxID=2972488 RepID=UPI002158F4F4|nr:acyltransferase family protein [Paenibacillus radicibacter]
MPGLDGLRALSLVVIIIYHLNPNWLPGGFLGVGIFFVLSGYLITDLLVTEWNNSGKLNLKNFWIRRFRRLLPCMFTMLLFVVAWLSLFDPSRLAALRGEIAASVLYFNNWYLIFHEVSYFEHFGPPSPLTHLWSLSVEEQFYIFWPLILFVGFRIIPKRKKLAGWIIVAAAVSACVMALIYEPGSDPSRVYYGTDTRVFALLIGAALALIWPSQKLSNRTSPRGRIVLDTIGGISLAVLLIMIYTANEYDARLYYGGLVFASLTAAMLVAVIVHPCSRLGQMFSIKPLRWIGVRSYGIYLWHYPIIALTTSKIGTESNLQLLILLQVAASFILAALSYRFIETPIRSGAMDQLWRQMRTCEWWQGCLTVNKGRGLIVGCSSILLLISIIGLILVPVPAHRVGNASEIPSVQSDTLNDSLQKKEQEKKQEQEQKVLVKEPAPTTNVQPSPKPPIKSPNNSDSNKSTTKESKESANPKPTSSGKGITVIGDSIMVDAAPYLQKYLPGIQVYSKIGRQMSQASGIIDQLKSDGKLGDKIVIGLGTNGPFSQKQLESLLNSLKNIKQVVLINTRDSEKWEKTVNDTLAGTAAKFANTTVLDWYAASSGKKSIFEPDGVHLVPEGAKLYASLIVDKVTS